MPPESLEPKIVLYAGSPWGFRMTKTRYPAHVRFRHVRDYRDLWGMKPGPEVEVVIGPKIPRDAALAFMKADFTISPNNLFPSAQPKPVCDPDRPKRYGERMRFSPKHKKKLAALAAQA